MILFDICIYVTCILSFFVFKVLTFEDEKLLANYMFIFMYVFGIYLLGVYYLLDLIKTMIERGF